MRVWKGDHGNRSIRAGMRLRIAPGVRASLVVVIDRLRADRVTAACQFPGRRRVNRVGADPLPDRGTPPRPRALRPGRSRPGPPPGGHHVSRGTSQRPRASNPRAMGMLTIMRLPDPRGPLSEALFGDLLGRTLSATTVERARRAVTTTGALTDDDLQIGLAVCYELHYRGFEGVAEDWEWDPGLIGLRSGLEEAHLSALRELVGPVPTWQEPVDRQLAALIAADDGPSLS